MRYKDISVKKIPTDIFTGVIIALVSIPISMGYAQVSGLPAVYGLYGSIFPILIFGLLSTSKQFIFGVDAAPAALVGAFLVSIEVESGSDRAVQVVPVVSFFVGIWLILMSNLRTGKLVSYISTPVMGGFISGISTTIIFMQIPKVMGGVSGTGEMFELVKHIIKTSRTDLNWMSLCLGTIALLILLVSKKFIPRVPMSIPVMITGAILGFTGFADRYSVARLENIERGLPAWKFPDFTALDVSDVMSTSLTVAIVIMAETLLASNNQANRNGYKLNNNHEILVYGLGNLAACFTGCCPVNGSVSRSSMNEQYGGSSQIVSVTAALTMACILLFGTSFIQYLPVPVLTAIVISALLGAVEFHLAESLFKRDKHEFFIFCAAFFGVLLFGTVYGVAIGIVLSFITVIVNTANPKRSFLGIIEGHEGFHSLERNTYAVPLKDVVLYRFSGNLFFANIDVFISDIEKAITKTTRCVVVDSGAICSIDVTAADRISALNSKLMKNDIKLYFASHIGPLNDRFRKLGLGDLVEQGHCRMTVAAALLDAGYEPPYVTEKGNTGQVSSSKDRFGIHEYEWMFGIGADENSSSGKNSSGHDRTDK